MCPSNGVYEYGVSTGEVFCFAYLWWARSERTKVGLKATHCAQNGSLHGVKSESQTAIESVITTLSVFAIGNLNYIF